MWLVARDQTRLMQHTLLIQIFRTHVPGPGSPCPAAAAVSCPAAAAVSCPSCAVWSARCCQLESGWGVLAALLAANTATGWDTALATSLHALTYQVIINCPVELSTNLREVS